MCKCNYYYKYHLFSEIFGCLQFFEVTKSTELSVQAIFFNMLVFHDVVEPEINQIAETYLKINKLLSVQ